MFIPRKQNFSNEPGAYKIVAALSSDVVDPGEAIVISVYISGYGNAKSAYFLYYPSSDFFEKEGSTIKYNPRRLDDGKIAFGGEESPLSENGAFLRLDSIKISEAEPEIFIDDPEVVGRVITETTQLGDSIVRLTIQVRQNARPGRHSISLLLKYYDGERWNVNKEVITFNVRTLFERNQTFIAFAGIVLTLGALFLQI